MEKAIDKFKHATTEQRGPRDGSSPHVKGTDCL